MKWYDALKFCCAEKICHLAGTIVTLENGKKIQLSRDYVTTYEDVKRPVKAGDWVLFKYDINNDIINYNPVDELFMNKRYRLSDNQ